MNQQLFDLDQALDDFEHEELDKLASGSSQSLFVSKPLQFTLRAASPSGAEKPDGNPPSTIINYLNSDVAASDEHFSVRVSEDVLRSEVLSEESKDISPDYVTSNSQASSDRNSHLMMEDQSSSNMDSGLCSSSEFTSFEALDSASQSHYHDNSGLLKNLYAASMLVENGISAPHQFTTSNELASSVNACNTASDSDPTIKTPTLMSPDSVHLLTPVSSNTVVNPSRRHSDVATAVLTDSSQTPTRPKLLDLSASCNMETTRNDAFFFPTEAFSSKSNANPYHSLPVVTTNGSSSSHHGSTSSNGGCRRPSSLLLSEPSGDGHRSAGRPASLQPPAVGTKRPSSLFGLPCLSGDGNNVDGSTGSSGFLSGGDKKMMLTAPNERSSSDFPVLMDVESTGHVTKSLADESTAIENDAVTILSSSGTGVASGRRSPSTLSANSEILQLPIPIIPSSTSSCSPDSASLSRSSLCDGSSPMTQPAFISSAAVTPATEDAEPPALSSPIANQASQLSEDNDEEEDGNAALAALEAAASATDQGRVLPCGDTLGRQAPPWVPDCDAPFCSGCGTKFTFTKRRHHCRACGKVYCNACCSLRYHLEFLNAIARVCVTCYPELVRLEARKNNADSGPPIAAPSALRNATRARGSTSSAGSSQGTVTGGSRPASTELKRNKKKVVFSDGVRPGESAATAASSSNNDSSAQNDTSSADVSPLEEPSTSGSAMRQVTSTASSSATSTRPSSANEMKVTKDVLIRAHYSWSSDQTEIFTTGLGLIFEGGEGIVLSLNSNLAIRIQRVDLSSCCCVQPANASNTESSSFYAIVSTGMCSAAECEYLLILRTNSLPGYIEVAVKFFERLWADAEQGKFYDDLSCLIIEPVGFVMFRPSFQCTQHLPLPHHARWLAAVMISDPNELAWARLFPLRLILRLGHEVGHYPAPIVSDMARVPLFHQPGHTVLSLFSDFRSFRYRLEPIEGALLHLDRACSSVSTPTDTPPQNRRHVLLLPVTAANQICQLASGGNEHVLAIGTSFSPSADGHLVAVQAASPDPTYRSEAITMLGVSGSEQTRIVAGSFIIFNGSLRPDPNGVKGRLTVLEDGAMLQITADQMAELRTALVAQQNFEVTCTTTNTPDGDLGGVDTLQIEWIKSSMDNSSQWTRPSIALRCRLPIGFNKTMMNSLANVLKCETSLRISAVYVWPFDSSSQAIWCSPAVFANATASLPGQSSQSADPVVAQSIMVAHVLDRASLAFASSTLLALAAASDALVRTSSRQSICDLPVQVIVRIRLDIENPGFEATMLSQSDGMTEYLPIPDTAVGALDAELIPTLFNVAQSLGAKLPPGGLCFEIILYAMPPVKVTVSNNQPIGSPSEPAVGNSAVKLSKEHEALAAEMLIDDA